MKAFGHISSTSMLVSLITLALGTVGAFIAASGVVEVAHLPILSLVCGFLVCFAAIAIAHTQRYSFQDTASIPDRARLLEENRMLKMTEAFAEVGHWKVDFETDEVFWSDQTFKIHGMRLGKPPPLDEAIKKFHQDDREKIAQAIETARTTGRPYRFKARLNQPDGSVRFTESVAQVETFEDGRPKAIFGTFADRTKDEEARLALEEARQAAQVASEAKGTFLARTSHEIRTPMNAIVGFADLLLTESLTDAQREKVQLIASSGRSMTAILNDVLDYSKIEAGHLSVSSGPVNLLAVVDEIQHLFHSMAHKKGLEIRVVIGNVFPPMIEGDGLRLRQILANLVSNAIKFTDEGRIILNLVSRGERFTIEVSDTGRGMAKEFAAKCFEPFSQSSMNDATTHQGTGLGLAICDQLIELMGGTISVSSKEGYGSSFLIDLPLVEATNHGPTARTAPSEVGKRTIRVLLAEDFDVNQMLMAEMAKKLAIELEIAEDGQQAIDAVFKADKDGTPFDLVLMDLQMPRLDGLEACRKLRSKGMEARILPILALTANAFPEDISACMEAGMQGHISKPVQLGTLEENIRQVLH